ncbi:alpha/beta fold hydrolase, partial [Gaiella sp.]|uniref:alpha/beta fold hydrolase n=1 Tax=Gaiella sp. TaxID=2663207 RepID=UPI003264603B
MSVRRMGEALRATGACVVICLAVASVVAAAGATLDPRDGPLAPLPRLSGSPGAAERAPLLASVGFRAGTRSVTTACGSDGLVCSDVVVPLDRKGVVPGAITLHVESIPAEGKERGVMMLVAGGPGQGSATVFDISDKNSALLFRALFPGYRIVAFDNRGTGKSGLIDCPALQSSTGFVNQDTLALGCATTIGPARDFYSTRDHADDTEAVRQALGVDKIAIWGISYGTKLALAYTLGYPTHVERLLLDSVVPTNYPDPYAANVLRDIPLGLADYCGISACRAATPNYAAEVTALANGLAARPVTGSVLRANGTKRKLTVSGLDVLSILVESDLNPGLAALLPAAVHAARAGAPAALLRLHDLTISSATSSAEQLSSGLNAATNCADGNFPWDKSAPVAERTAKLEAAVAALPAGSLGGFGPWAIDLGAASFCVKWPSPTAPIPALGTGPLPDVPVLAVNGGFDLRTPVSSARTVIAGFPHGQLLVVPSVGHSTVTADPSICALHAVRAWIDGDRVPASCARAPFIVAPVAAYPRKPSHRSAKVLGSRVTLDLARRTVRDATALWAAAAAGPGRPVGGLTSGSLTTGA